MKAIKSDSDSDSDEQKRSPGFSGKNRGVIPSVAASRPGVTHPSDATVIRGVISGENMGTVAPRRRVARGDQAQSKALKAGWHRVNANCSQLRML